ncbi:hypothetical protein PAHAL_9G053300 [Panicum hallii]|uniref:Uncharacterized protein n=1 Tax=Panicum hallii TaxID=206008 RepID=A0A2T8I071_9POAL|nr:hypothetical protein PAHAL_9G053300 [Panicum hallii]
MGDDFSLCFWNRLVMFRSLFCNVDPGFNAATTKGKG